MKFFLAFLVALAIILPFGAYLAQAADLSDNSTQETYPVDNGPVNPVPGLSWTSSPGLGQGWWEPGAPTALAMCPFCGRSAEIMQTHRNHPVFGFEMIEWTLYCDICKYTSERDLQGSLKPITKEAQAEWGAKNWPVNEIYDPLIKPLFVPVPEAIDE